MQIKIYYIIFKYSNKKVYQNLFNIDEKPGPKNPSVVRENSLVHYLKKLQMKADDDHSLF